MAHYEDMRQAQAHKQRQEQMDRERLWEVNRLRSLIATPEDHILETVREIRSDMAEIKEEIEKLKKILSSGSKEGWL